MPSYPDPTEARPYFVEEGPELGTGIPERPWHYVYAHQADDEHNVGAFAIKSLAVAFAATLNDLLSKDPDFGFSVLSRFNGDAVLHLPPSYFEVEEFRKEDIWSFEFGNWEFASFRDVGGFYPFLFHRELTQGADGWAEADVKKWKTDGERTAAARALKNMATADPLEKRIFRFFHGLMREGYLVNDNGLSDIWGRAEDCRNYELSTALELPPSTEEQREAAGA